MARDVFRKIYPQIEFCRKIQVWMDVIKCCIPCVIILRSFCFKPRMVSGKNTRRNIFTIILLCSFHKGITTKSENSCYLLKVLVLGQKLILGKPSNCASCWRSGFPSNTTLYVHISRFMLKHNKIYSIYDKYMHLQPPFQTFVNRKLEGV